MDIDAALGSVKMEITQGLGESASPMQTSVPAQASRNEMYDKFQAWALQNYGDSGKTKTVTRKKYLRIVRILTGKEHATSENSKFRFWVKAKGFRMGPPPPDDNTREDQVLYVPTRVQTGVNGEAEEKQYKRVAVVEDFFEIIYNVHVEMDGRGGKHAGQKRTYRAIAETYSFLPREAVTRFLMSCADCQKRMHLSLEHNNNDLQQPLGEDAPIIDFSLPITTTYLNHLRAKNSFTEDSLFNNDREESMSSGESEVSRERSPSPSEGHTPSPLQQQQQLTTTIKSESETASLAGASAEQSELEVTSLVINNMTAKTESECPVNVAERNGTASSEATDAPFTRTVTTVKQEDRGHPERKRRASNESNSTRASENGLGDDVKEDEEEDENEEDEKMSNGTEFDPERLKAFNMFVRLFVDENLDRMVPISKQPKDKIQAILDACDRQFPEFHERARKRIRTYLKSCRRMRRSKDGWESMRPTPPHLTSAAAEALLAQACENESNNAKRMRMGLDPLPASSVQASQSQQTSPQSQPSPSSQRNSPQTSSSSTSSSGTMSSSSSSSSAAERPTPASSEYLHNSSSPAGFRPPHELPSPFFSNSNGIFRPGFPTYQPPAHHHPPVVHAAAAAAAANSMHNGNGKWPTDLSMKKSGSSKNQQLNPTEVSTIKQLIAGYRESAAFLYRSADELEQLLLQQN